MNIKKSFLALLLSAMCLVTGCASQSQTSDSSSNEVTSIVIETSVETTVEETEETTQEVTTEIATTVTTPEENTTTTVTTTTISPAIETVKFDLSNVPAFSGNPYVIINDNNPYFTPDEIASN